MNNLKYLSPVYWRRVLFRAKKFKNNINQVSIEFNSTCNRKCIYCPHSLIEREKTFLCDNLIEKVLNELAEIDYDKWICLNLFNEPLIEKKRLKFVMQSITKKIPNAHISFSTNGDYLTKYDFSSLQNDGLSRLDITIHQNTEKAWDSDNVKKSISMFLQKLGWDDYDIAVSEGNAICQFNIKNTNVNIFSRNFIQNGVNRAGVLKTVASASGFTRVSPCFRPTNEIQISYDGSVYPCCQFFHGLEETRKYMIGNINNQHLVDIYFNKSFIRFRDMAASTVDQDPCNSCSE